MNKKNSSISFILGLSIIFITILLFFIFQEKISYKVYFFTLFLSSCLILPKGLQDFKNDVNITPVDYRNLFVNIVSIFLMFIAFLICLIKDY